MNKALYTVSESVAFIVHQKVVTIFMLAARRQQFLITTGSATLMTLKSILRVDSSVAIVAWALLVHSGRYTNQIARATSHGFAVLGDQCFACVHIVSTLSAGR